MVQDGSNETAVVLERMLACYCCCFLHDDRRPKKFEGRGDP